ncbi:MAG: fasciclin domain-containing protein [Intrasporangium sp.]|uniref:fasciclin domain-containing protein n=1 Tax=Intrasporangium sp. TaxID=1925024 RepID=UPI00264A1B5C|nr:fasciclin domain-containing protein [Intrasporangium sp.]MDN5796184.1 fasciclin domain-containing protein [Intrasporangium sp.]
MFARRATIALSVATLATAVLAPAANAQGTRHHSLGARSLAQVLTSDGNQFDRNWYDYDILTEAVMAVLTAKPDSPVKVLTDGNTAVTAFIPNDRAFQALVADLTGRWYPSEKTVFTGATITVRSHSRRLPIIELRDGDPNDVNPFVNPAALNINKGNKQIAHGIIFVLRPVDL